MKRIPIDYHEKIVPDAYHGTSMLEAESIQAAGEFICGTNDELYLGKGVYFFESSEWNAKDWAIRHTWKKFRHDKIGVLCATVNLGRCLDLNNSKHRDLIVHTADHLRTRMPMKKITDAVVINFMAETFSGSIDTIRATYLPQGKDKKRLFWNSRFLDLMHIMICVRNTKNILNISEVYKGKANEYMV